MATFTNKKLAFGKFLSSKADVYAPTGAVTGLMHNMIIHNTSTGTQTTTLYINDASVEHQIYNFSLAGSETVQFSYVNEGLIFNGTRKLTGFSTSSGTVTYFINGTEET